MKHPLTSKERRGLVAVAAAALLCIASGFIVRNCGNNFFQNSTSTPNSTPTEKLPSDSADYKESLELKDRQTSKSRKRDGNANKKRKTKKSKSRNKKVYPTRDPLSQPCD